MKVMKLTPEDHQLVDAAREQLLKAYDPVWHSVGAAIRTTTGTVYTGINVDTSTGGGGGADAEMSALCAAVSAGDKTNIETIVAVGKDKVLPPCGVCRQTLITHAPQVEVILPEAEADKLIKVPLRELLPYAFENVRTPDL